MRVLRSSKHTGKIRWNHGPNPKQGASVTRAVDELRNVAHHFQRAHVVADECQLLFLANVSSQKHVHRQTQQNPTIARSRTDHNIRNGKVQSRQSVQTRVILTTSRLNVTFQARKLLRKCCLNLLNHVRNGFTHHGRTPMKRLTNGLQQSTSFAKQANLKKRGNQKHLATRTNKKPGTCSGAQGRCMAMCKAAITLNSAAIAFARNRPSRSSAIRSIMISDTRKRSLRLLSILASQTAVRVCSSCKRPRKFASRDLSASARERATS